MPGTLKSRKCRKPLMLHILYIGLGFRAGLTVDGGVGGYLENREPHPCHIIISSGYEDRWPLDTLYIHPKP